MKMKTVNLGHLKIGDTFYFEGQKYRANSLGDRPINAVNCTCVDTKKRERLDVDTEVEVEDLEEGD